MKLNYKNGDMKRNTDETAKKDGKMKRIVKVLIKPFKKIIFWIKLKDMDVQWYWTGGSCFGLFPPSFYYTHTEEEIERITAETAERIGELIDQLEKLELEKNSH